MIRRPPRSTPLYSSAASDVYKRQKLCFPEVFSLPQLWFLCLMHYRSKPLQIKGFHIDLLLFQVQNVWSSICIQLLLYHNNPNNVYLHSFPVTLEFLELSYRNNIKRNQETHLTFTQKTPTLYQWTTKN